MVKQYNLFSPVNLQGSLLGPLLFDNIAFHPTSMRMELK